MRALVVLSSAALPERRATLRALLGMGCEVTVAAGDRMDGSASVSWAGAGGVRVLPIPVRGSDPAEQRWKSKALRRLMTELRPAIVQVEAEPHWPVAATVTALAQRLRTPSVIVASESVPRPLSVLQRLRRRRVLRRAKGIAGINRLALELLADSTGNKPHGVLRLTPANVPLNGPALDPDRPFTVGCVGRLVPERGVDVLLRGVARLRGQWRLLLAGTGPAQEELEELAERLGIGSRVSWLGGIPAEHISDLWPQLDCLALPSRSTAHWVEPVARVVVEAMANSIPVVGSDTGAIPEVIGEAGIVVPPEDPDAVGLALERLQHLPDERVQLGLAGRRRVIAEFVPDALARKTVAFWRQVASS